MDDATVAVVLAKVLAGRTLARAEREALSAQLLGVVDALEAGTGPMAGLSADLAAAADRLNTKVGPDQAESRDAVGLIGSPPA